MKKIPSLALVVALVLAAGCAPKVDDPADAQAVTKTVEAFGAAMNAGDADGMVAMMTDRTVYADNHFPVAVGKAAVQLMSAAQNSQFRTEFKVPVDEVRVAGDVAVARGTWAITLTPKAEGMAPVIDRGSWMLTAGRQADRSWKWEWVMANSDQPMPGATADGAEEQAIVKIEQDWAAAYAKADLALMDRTIAKEYMENADGEVMSKAQGLAALKAGAFKFESVKVRDLSVHVFGYVAIATSTVEVKGTYLGKPLPPLQRSTDIFTKRDGRWQAVSTQNVTIK
jgi:ketosteroid isomerase-like protein